MNSTNKQVLILLTGLSFASSTISCNMPSGDVQAERPIKVPDGIDGNRLGINGHEIRNLMYIRKKVQDQLHGTLDPVTKERTGIYIFQGQYHSIASLTQFEKNNPHMTTAVRVQLYSLLEIIKADFVKIADPFVKQAYGVKGITLKFMEQWSTLHNRENSYLLVWGKEKDGHEFETFNRETTTFVHLNDFCTDLISFISDLIQSCPRAWKQFLELQRKK
ncbi:MAG: hypothetical protein WDZ41_02100 [Candidatus Babeliales bacterium]